MRVLHAYKVYGPDIEGGIPAVIKCLAKDRSNQHAVFTARLAGPGRRFTAEGAAIEAVGSFGTLFSTPVAPLYVPALCRRMRNADVVVHHAPLPLNDAAVMLGLPNEVALVLYWHADVLTYPLLQRMVSPLTRAVLARADRIVVSGRPMIAGNQLLAAHADKCDVLPYGIDLSAWRHLDADERLEVAHLQQRTPCHIVAIGRLVGYKGFDVLVRAMREVDAHATIIGDGPLLGDLQALAASSGVADRITFAGRVARRDIKILLHAAQVLAFPSVTEAEAFGLVQVEAMAAGLPIVNTSLPTTAPEVARDGCEALTVAPNDPSAFARALNQILDDPALAGRLRASARLRADSEFDQQIFRDRMSAVYLRARDARARRLGS